MAPTLSRGLAPLEVLANYARPDHRLVTSLFLLVCPLAHRSGSSRYLSGLFLRPTRRDAVHLISVLAQSSPGGTDFNILRRMLSRGFPRRCRNVHPLPQETLATEGYRFLDAIPHYDCHTLSDHLLRLHDTPGLEQSNLELKLHVQRLVALAPRSERVLGVELPRLLHRLLLQCSNSNCPQRRRYSGMDF